ncbi:MAG TPA: 4'-phosphopantetheinyl transferase superfamily protein [Candidatus Desulfovibrio intestinipullorum]|uniref:4'-phosphopantetheinyl transferase superfamily protein n=1 Tax=Candidatus Desulfovibrio intestinipullorum TaxID=2838536 RepID=A0A9D1PVW0_9BACT|nr:4'-phosphopantetheinyl transferase superfamily protein [Candidatus Desulfovibrio intestinipullorum]
MHANLASGSSALLLPQGPGLLDPVACHVHGPGARIPGTLGRLFCQCCTLLDETERASACRFRHARDSLLYAAAHALLRLALSRHHPDIHPSAWRFCRGRYGKPRLAVSRACPQGPGRLRFSLSHAWPHIAVLVTRSGHCGVDIEPSPAPAGFETMAQTVFPAEECAELRASSSPQRHFLCLWTAREALCKALGCGFPRGFPHLLLRRNCTSFFLHGRPLPLQNLAFCTSSFVLSACILTRNRLPGTTLQEFDLSGFDSSRNFPEDGIQCQAMQQQVHHCSGV